MRKSRFTEAQIIGMLKEQEAGMPTAEVCRRHGLSPATFYKLKAKYGGMEVSEARCCAGRSGRHRGHARRSGAALAEAGRGCLCSGADAGRVRFAAVDGSATRRGSVVRPAARRRAMQRGPTGARADGHPRQRRRESNARCLLARSSRSASRAACVASRIAQVGHARLGDPELLMRGKIYLFSIDA